MIEYSNDKLVSAVFITFSGDCKKALTFYQTCFGGTLHFETFEEELQGFYDMPVVNGTLISEKITIHGSDLVHNEGRKLGNYISIFLQCENAYDRKKLIEKLASENSFIVDDHDNHILIEITDVFDVRWVLGV